MRLAACIALTVLCAFGCPITLAGQGNGNAYGHYKKGGSSAPSSVPSAAGSPEIAISGTGIRNFGSWLDDASVLPEGDAFVSIGFGLWNMPGYREIDVPTIDGAFGVHRRVQVGGSLPYYHASEPGGPIARGFGNSYVTAKVQLREARKGRIGLAVTPLLEMLTSPPAAGESRYSWGVPLNLEIQGTGWRSFASVGYFSRGAVFASGAVEVPIAQRAWITGSISTSHSMKADALSFALGLAKTRVDVSGAMSVAVARRLAAYGSVGRTISRADANSANLALTGGVAIQFSKRP